MVRRSLNWALAVAGGLFALFGMVILAVGTWPVGPVELHPLTMEISHSCPSSSECHLVLGGMALLTWLGAIVVGAVAVFASLRPSRALFAACGFFALLLPLPEILSDRVRPGPYTTDWTHGFPEFALLSVLGLAVCNFIAAAQTD